MGRQRRSEGHREHEVGLHGPGGNPAQAAVMPSSTLLTVHTGVPGHASPCPDMTCACPSRVLLALTHS